MRHAPTRRMIGCCLLVGVALLAGCSTSPPVAYYTLSPLPAADQDFSSPTGGSGLVVGVGPVTFPEFLDRPQIVTRSGPNRLEVSEFHRWGGSLKDSLPRVLAQGIAAHLGTDQVAAYPWKDRLKPDYRVTVAILQFDGRLGDAVDLVAVWRIFHPPANNVLTARRSTIHTAVTGEGYEAFVAAQSQAIGTLGQSIAEDIAELTQGQ